MNLSDYVIEASAQQYQNAFGSHPIFVTLQQGDFSRRCYLDYLRETYHSIRHTTSIMARAASHLTDDHRSLRGWLLEQALDEHNHDLLCITDIRALGESPDDFLAVPPKRGAWGLITQGYFLAENDPVSILGYFLTTEGIGASYAAKYADLLTSETYGYKSNQVTFLRAHGTFDLKHIEEVKKFMNDLNAPDRVRESILAVRRFSIAYYSQLLRDALESAPSNHNS
jgi:pyrroloquinoline quinone (PQQ) biosynthesis protein C